jgi:phosphoserine aminotransferase
MSQPYDRVYNFSPGPCTLPVEVLEEARDDLLNWKGAGMSVMEMSHRGPHFEKIIAEAEADLRQLLGIPKEYRVLFLQGGASLQNTMIPMNLVEDGETCDYVVTGSWGKKSYEAAVIAGNAHLAYDGKSHNYSDIPNLAELPYSEKPGFIHYTSNETIQGVEFQSYPQGLPAPAICDMSSDILSRPIDVTKYGLIYAGAQKNMGPAGIAVVIISGELIERCPEKFHPMLSYRIHAENDSMYNTPPTWTIYMCGLVYKWVQRQGGLEAIHERNREKAAILYDAIDSSDGFYKGHACRDCRSLMNVTFTLADDDLTKRFVQEAEAEKLDGLKGHRSVGGCRASIYNAFPREGCERLAQFMKEFAQKNG